MLPDEFEGKPAFVEMLNELSELPESGRTDVLEVDCLLGDGLD
jgi:hypothetical protein